MSRVSGCKWLVLLLSIAASTAAKDVSKLALSQTFVSRECRVRFSYPAKWHVDALENCRFRIHRSESGDDSALDTDIYGISIGVSDGPFQEAAQKAGFERRDGKWLFRGKAEVAADAIKIGASRGFMVADFPCRTYDENGYVGMGDCAAAVLGLKGQAASFYANAASAELLPRIVQSFRFESTPSK